MTPDDLIELSRRFDEALDLAPAERQPWLLDLQATQPALAGRLRAMLREHEAGRGTTLLPPLTGDSPDDGVAEAGERVGPYRLLHEIGRGGMGSVWLAERADGAFQRRVALKLPRLTWAAGLARRMSREREIGARLEHPHIARLYDAGVDQLGRPFIAMELIDGEPIDAWCRRLALDTHARLRLFLQVVRAVAHAHGRLVLHRDLKPANVLVDAQGQVHLLDFGIATLLGDAAEPTLEHGRALTPTYASPEQIAGRPLDVTSDVYSLGVLLYELLVERLPYELPRRTLGALEEAILAGDAPPPSQRAAEPALARALRGDVDAIVAKAIRRQPDERYASADALGDDLERVLTGHATQARPDSRWRRLWRLCRRHQLALGAGALVLAALAGGGGTAALQAHRAREAAAREQLVKDFVTEVFRAGTRGLPPERALEQTAQLVESRFADQPLLQAELYGVIAATFAGMGVPTHAAAYAQRQLGLHDTPAARLLLARTLYDAGRLAEAEPQARHAQAGADAALAAEAGVLLARVLTARGRLAEGEALLDSLATPGAGDSLPAAWRLYLKAFHERRQGRFETALPGFRDGVAMAERVAGNAHADVQWMKLDFGYELIVRHRRDEALSLVEPALAAMRVTGAAGTINAARRRVGLWATMGTMGQVPAPEVLREIDTLQAEIERLPLPPPEDIRARFDFDRARMLGQHGRIAEAAALMDRSVPLLLAGAEFAGTRFTLVSAHARVTLLAGDHTRAHALLLERLRLREVLGQTRIPFAANDHATLALNHLMLGELDAAQAVLERAPRFSAEAGDPRSGGIYAELIPWERARVLLHQGRVAEARTASDALVAMDDNTGLQSAAALRAEILCAAGQAGSAGGLPVLQALLARRATEVDAADPVLARHRAVAGLCALALDLLDEASGWAQQAAAAFARQPRVSPYFKAPLLALQAQLAQRAPRT